MRRRSARRFENTLAPALALAALATATSFLSGCSNRGGAGAAASPGGVPSTAQAATAASQPVAPTRSTVAPELVVAWEYLDADDGTSITLSTPGEEPRQRRDYEPLEGLTQTAIVATAREQVVRIEGVETERSTRSATMVLTSTLLGAVDEGIVTAVRYDQLDFSASDPITRAYLELSYGHLEGEIARWLWSPNGVLLAIEDGTDSDLWDPGSLYVPLPSDAFGIGATWRSEQPEPADGVAEAASSTAGTAPRSVPSTSNVTDISGSLVALDLWGHEERSDVALSAPGSAGDGRLARDVTGSGVWDLNGLFPVEASTEVVERLEGTVTDLGFSFTYEQIAEQQTAIQVVAQQHEPDGGAGAVAS